MNYLCWRGYVFAFVCLLRVLKITASTATLCCLSSRSWRSWHGCCVHRLWMQRQSM